MLRIDRGGAAQSAGSICFAQRRMAAFGRFLPFNPPCGEAVGRGTAAKRWWRGGGPKPTLKASAPPPPCGWSPSPSLRDREDYYVRYPPQPTRTHRKLAERYNRLSAGAARRVGDSSKARPTSSCRCVLARNLENAAFGARLSATPSARTKIPRPASLSAPAGARSASRPPYAPAGRHRCRCDRARNCCVR